MLIADTGPRLKRVMELMEFASGAMPQLDGAADIVREDPYQRCVAVIRPYASA
ncbi:hypothetical protein HHL21_06620 [Massilia sp. RP-1-19]|uniref:Uncharacterized protein n=1 Tax=Massilia polaris TaxID=2728846 RepID=A0A848HLG7_9BURK|nr:hypothetical protein [Massilia polaris]NML60761.1 hypothetical protein [Massilia polaris]